MKTVTLRHPAGLDNLVLTDMPDPGEPGVGEIRVRLHASSVNFHDLLVVTGQMPAANGRIPMSDGAGVVEAVGKNVSEFAVGDRVVSTFFPGWLNGGPTQSDFSTTPGDGVDGYAREVVVTPAHAFTHAPIGYSHTEAATLTTAGVTAWRALAVNGGLKAGDTVLVLGTGGVSVFALQLAKVMGATVIATSSSDEKLERLRQLGADHLINYRSEPQWGLAVQQLTGGGGVDHVVEIGGAGTLVQSMLATRVGGHVAVIGVLDGAEGPIPTAMLMARQLRVQGLGVGSREHQLELVRALNATGIRPVIDKAFALQHIADAFRWQQSGRHLGKIVLDYAM